MSTVDGLVGDIDIADEAAAAPRRFSGLSRKYGPKAGCRVGCSRCRPW